MGVRRIVVGAIRQDDLARRTARRLRDAGEEVVLVGGSQSPEQLVRTAIAEDALEIVVDADEAEVCRILELLVELEASDVMVRLADDAPSVRRSPR